MGPALSFSCEEKKQAIINKNCNQTIRPRRKNPIKVGDRIYIYWKQRVSKENKTHHKIGEGIVTEVKKAEFVKTCEDYINFFSNLGEHPMIIAKKDGFNNFKEFINWFENRYGEGLFSQTFKIIRWEWSDD